MSENGHACAAPLSAEVRESTFHSSSLGREVAVAVQLPPSYASGTGRYPVLYVLHGLFENEQFWQRRDPTPATSENEFKAEHYGRIAVANQRFSGSVPGWKTDRGMIFIMLGPPDAIEYRAGTATEPPTELWTYRHIEGLGDNVPVVFVDTAGSGDFRLQQDPRSH